MENPSINEWSLSYIIINGKSIQCGYKSIYKWKSHLYFIWLNGYPYWSFHTCNTAKCLVQTCRVVNVTLSDSGSCQEGYLPYVYIRHWHVSGFVHRWVCLKMLCTPFSQWFCWSLSLWKMAISLGRLTQHFQTNPDGVMSKPLSCNVTEDMNIHNYHLFWCEPPAIFFRFWSIASSQIKDISFVPQRGGKGTQLAATPKFNLMDPFGFSVPFMIWHLFSNFGMFWDR